MKNSSQQPEAAARQRFLTTAYYPAFDGLRCAAICAVVWHHSLPRPLPGVLGRGYLGVPLFFALSGFLITTLLLAERRLTGEIALGSFWMRRCLRIFPLYYAVLLLFAFSLAVREPSEARQHFFRSLPFYVSYTSNWFVDYGVAHPIWFGFAWSLSAEEQFYAWWPALLRQCQRWTSWAAVGALLGLLGLSQLTERGVFASWISPHGVAERVLTSFAASMSLGALLALLMAERRAFAWVWRVLGRRASAPVCLLALATFVWRPPTPFLLFELLLACLVAACALQPAPGWLRAAATRPLLHLGRVSYGMYLFHVPVLGLLRRCLPWLVERPACLFPLALGVTWGAATLSYRYLESPILKLQARYRPLRPPSPDSLDVAPASLLRAS
jgi:peptidoglycan/LPS O-acetylase OafA/YrhL